MRILPAATHTFTRGLAAQGPPPPDAIPNGEGPTVPLPDGSFRMVSIGDSLTAGTQDGCTLKERQARCYMKQLGDHAGVTFNMPELNNEGIPCGLFHDGSFDYRHLKSHILKLGLAVAPLGVYTYFIGAPRWIVPTWDAVPGMGKRTIESRDTPEHPQGNFAIAGFELRHLTSTHNMRDYLKELHEGTAGLGSLAQEVPLIRATLGNGKNSGNGSQFEQAVAKNPDLAVVWAGNNDALSPVFSGRIDDSTLTPLEDQQWTYQVTNPITSKSHRVTTDKVKPGFRSQVLGPDGLVPRLLKDTKAELVMMNIPDVRVIPLLREVGKPIGDLPFRVYLKKGQDVTDLLERMVIPTTIDGPGVGGRADFPSGTRVNLMAVVQAVIAKGIPETREQLEQQLAQASQGGFLKEDDVLDPDELAVVGQRIRDFNSVLAQAAGENPRVHLVDVNAVLTDAMNNGRELKGAGPREWVGTSFTGAPDGDGRDGMFSWDGVHPSDTGHAILANVVLEKVQADLAGRPEFALFRNLPPIDEKAVHRQDPHKPGTTFGIVLDDQFVEHWVENVSI